VVLTGSGLSLWHVGKIRLTREIVKEDPGIKAKLPHEAGLLSE